MDMSEFSEYLKKQGLFSHHVGPLESEFEEIFISDGDGNDDDDDIEEDTTNKNTEKKGTWKKKPVSMGGVDLGIDDDDEIANQGKSKPKEKVKIFRPLITAPKIDLSVMFEQYINTCRRFYGVKESTNFQNEYEFYCMNHGEFGLNKRKESSKGQKRGLKNKQQPDPNPYIREFSPTRSKRRARGNSTIIPELPLEVEVEKPEDTGKPKTKSPDKANNVTEPMKYCQVRKAVEDHIVDNTDPSNLSKYKFPWTSEYEKDDEWEDIADPESDIWKKTDLKLDTICEKKDAETNTDPPEEDIEKIREKAKEIVSRYSSGAVKRKRPSRKQEIVIPTRSYTKSKFIRQKRKKVSATAEVEIVDLEPKEQPNFKKAGSVNDTSHSEFVDILEKFSKLRSSPSHASEFDPWNSDLPDESNWKDISESGSEMDYEDEEMDKNEGRVGSKRIGRKKRKESPVKTVSYLKSGIHPKAVQDSLLIRTGEIYTEEELEAIRPKVDSDLPSHILIKATSERKSRGEQKISTQELWRHSNPENPIEKVFVAKTPGLPETVIVGSGGGKGKAGQIMEIKYHEYPGRLSYSKHKVQKYKFVTSQDMIQEFVQVTYPTMRKRLAKSNKIQASEFRPKPTPKRHDFLLRDSAQQFESLKSIVCAKLKMSAKMFDKVVEEISPAVGKSYHDVQFEKSMIQDGPLQYLPSSLPSSYCKKSKTLSYLRDCTKLMNSSADPKTNTEMENDEIIYTYPHLVVPDPETYLHRSTPIVPGSRFLDAPMDMVFSVVIFSPPKLKGDIRTILQMDRDATHMPVSSRVELLGSQSLGKIRDMFVCHSDCYDSEETHHLPEKVNPVAANRTTKAASPMYAFLVGDLVLVDYADFHSIVFAKRIKGWYAANQPDRVIEINDSVNTRISDMTISLGEPYVFIHQENCQHIFQFKGGRVCIPNETDNAETFPRYIYKNNSLILCRIDKKYPARWSVNGFKELPEPSMLLCNRCVRNFCFNKDGTKRGDFKLYQFNATI